MLLVLGGTTEGRIVVEELETAGKPFYYSTKGTTQKVCLHNGIAISGAMDSRRMEDFCVAHAIRAIVDAAHPFAEELHATVVAVARKLCIPAIRYERFYPPLQEDVTVRLCSGYDELIERLFKDDVRRLLALTGVQTITRLSAFWKQRTTWFRILDRETSFQVAQKSGFPLTNLFTYHQGEDELEVLRKIAPDAIATKESGESGGLTAKIAAARAFGIPCYVVKRPTTSSYYTCVEGKYAFRMAVQRLLPDFYDLKIGYTTGTCATAASIAALKTLLGDVDDGEVACILPNGECHQLPVEVTLLRNNQARGVVIKNAGDDPDVTDGMAIGATVEVNSLPELSSSDCVITIEGGVGVGRVTIDGLGIPIGEAAINATPREMIRENIQAVLDSSGEDVSSVKITIDVPDGETIAQKTFNPRLGIVGGISIIGTSGIVKPFSSEAFIRSIEKEMQVAKAVGMFPVLINSGAKSEQYLKALYPNHPLQSMVHYGNFIGATLEIASRLELPSVAMGIMVGKAVKLAEGNMDTHSKKTVMNIDFILKLARRVGCSPSTLAQIAEIKVARSLWELLKGKERKSFFTTLLSTCTANCKSIYPNGQFTLYLIDEAGNINNF